MEAPELPEETSQRPYVKNAHTEELVDHYWGSISYISSLIKSSELKAGLILSFYGILLNFVFQGVDTVFDASSKNNFLYILIAGWFFCTAASIFYCMRCFIPRIEDTYDKNIFFFRDITTKFGNIKEFSKTFYNVSIDEENLFGQLGEQIFIISKIAAWKFRNVKRAIILLAIGLMMLFVTAGYYMILTLT